MRRCAPPPLVPNVLVSLTGLQIRSFVQRFYQFIEGVSQHHRNVDELLSKVRRTPSHYRLHAPSTLQSLDTILRDTVTGSFLHRLSRLSQPSQVAQLIANLEHFTTLASELEHSLTALRATQRGGTVRIGAGAAFGDALAQARARIGAVIASKLDDFFGLSEYDWTPPVAERVPSMYLTELVAWLSTIVDSLQIRDAYKADAYRGAGAYIAQCLMVRATPEHGGWVGLG
jgi:hypothetical protein